MRSRLKQVELPPFSLLFLLNPVNSSYSFLSPSPAKAPLMKDFSLFLLKYSIASKMKKGFRNFCSGVGSTSTVNQHSSSSVAAAAEDVSSGCVAAGPSLVGSFLEESTIATSPLTLEQMILQLDLEEEAARRAKLGEIHRRRMSCVNNADILRSARNALNQYPRFSLDGKDAMYPSSFRNNFNNARPCPPPPRRSGSQVINCCCRDCSCHADDHKYCRIKQRLPSKLVAGEAVVWCKPGVVAKLMGLDAVPVLVPRARAGRREVG